MSFQELKANRQANLTKITKNLENAIGGQKQVDERFWQPTLDKAGNGYAVFRFLPQVEGEDIPYVRYWDHGFRGPGGWYIEKNLNSIDLADPVSEFNTQLWNSVDEHNSPERNQARAQRRRLHFISNIYMLNDPANSGNNGKVFLYKYGKTIYDMIFECNHPKFPDQPVFNPFCLWDGANFNLKICTLNKQRNYDRSGFDKPSPLFGAGEEFDSKRLEVYKKEYPLLPFLDKSQFKTYDELKARLMKVLGVVPQTTQAALNETSQPNVGKEVHPNDLVNNSTPPWTDDSDLDSELAEFRKLAE